MTVTPTDTRTFVLATALLGGVIALGVSVQAIVVLGAHSSLGDSIPLHPALDLLRRIVVNFSSIAFGIFVGARTSLVAFPGLAVAWRIVLISLMTALARFAGQLATGIYGRDSLLNGIADLIAAACVLPLVFGFAVWVTQAQQRARAAERRELVPTVRTATSLAVQYRDDLRRRWAGVHDTARVTADSLRRAEHELAEIAAQLPRHEQLRVDAVREELRDLRERDVRQLADALAPASLEDGLAGGLRRLAERVPAPARVQLDITAETETYAVEPVSGAVLLTIVDEIVSTALLRASALEIRIALSTGSDRLRLSIEDDGVEAMDARYDAVAGLTESLRRIGGSLRFQERAARPTVLVRVPLHR